MQGPPGDGQQGLQAQLAEATARIMALTLQCRAQEQQIRQLQVSRGLLLRLPGCLRSSCARIASVNVSVWECVRL